MKTKDRHHFDTYREQTRVKHIIVEKYINAFFTILKKPHPRLYYIDGFAGKGTYDQGGDIMLASDFFEATYNETPAHSDDIKKVFIENPDIEVVTKNGGVRRVHGTIKPSDKIKLTYQRSIFLPS